jgi:hypothetical protein
LTFRVSGKCTNQRSCQTHNTDKASSSHNIFASPPFTALHSITQPTICLSRPSILPAGRRLRSCCLTSVSNRSCSRVLHAGAKATATSLQHPSLCDARSLAAAVWPANTREIRRTTHCCCSRCFRRRRSAVTPDFAHATVAPAIDESHLRPAFATLLRTRLTTPLSCRRGNYLEYLLCQRCHGKLLPVPLSDFALFLVVSRIRQPRVRSLGQDHHHQDQSRL